MADWIDREIDANFDKARAGGAVEREGAPYAVSARYSVERGVCTIAFDNGTEVSIRRHAETAVRADGRIRKLRANSFGKYRSTNSILSQAQSTL